MSRSRSRRKRSAPADVPEGLGGDPEQEVQALLADGYQAGDSVGGQRVLGEYGGFIPSVGVTQYGQPGSKPMEVAPQYPQMDKISPQTPPMEIYGGTGVAIFSGIITSEEYNPDLYWREAVRVYEQMRRNDYQVFSSLTLLELPIRGAEWGMRPASDSPFDVEVAALAESATFHELRRQTWDDVLRQQQIMEWAGFMVFEPEYRVDDEGRVLWDRIGPRLPRTIWRWWIDDGNDLVGVQQWTFKQYTYQYIDIPVEKIALYTNRMEGNNFEGVSVLRTAYKPWFYKEALLRLMAVGFEREHVGVPVIKLPQGHTNADLNRAASIGKNIRSNEQSYVTLPFGWELDLFRSSTSSRSSSHTPILDAIALMDIAISRNVHAQVQNLGSNEVGSFALSDSQSDILLMSLEAKAKQQAAVTNDQLLKRLLDYNYEGLDRYPQLECRRIHSFDFMEVSNAVSNLIRFGGLTAEQNLEDFLREMLGIPSAPHNPVVVQQGQGAIDQTNPPGGEADPKGGSKSKGPGEGGRNVQAAEWMPAEYRTDAYLGDMTRAQRRCYEGQVRRVLAARQPYEVTVHREPRALADVIELANRRAPEDAGYQRRVDAVRRRLGRNYRDLESRLERAARGELNEARADELVQRFDADTGRADADRAGGFRESLGTGE